MRILSIFALVFLFSNVAAHAQGRSNVYYIERDDGELTKIEDGDPDRVGEVKEWQFRLYKKDEPATGKNYWGIVSGQTWDEAYFHLEDNQRFQKVYAKFAGYDYQDEVYTYFNVQGPIAVLKPPKNPGTMEKVVGIAKRVDEVRKILVRIDSVMTTKLKRHDPFKEVGAELREYADTLKKVLKPLAEVEKAARKADAQLSNIELQLSEIEANTRQLELRAPAVDKKIDEIASKLEAGLVGSWATGSLHYQQMAGSVNYDETIQQQVSLQLGVLTISEVETEIQSVPGSGSGLPIRRTKFASVEIADLDPATIVVKAYPGRWVVDFETLADPGRPGNRLRVVEEQRTETYPSYPTMNSAFTSIGIFHRGPSPRGRSRACNGHWHEPVTKPFMPQVSPRGIITVKGGFHAGTASVVRVFQRLGAIRSTACHGGLRPLRQRPGLRRRLPYGRADLFRK